MFSFFRRSRVLLFALPLVVLPVAVATAGWAGHGPCHGEMDPERAKAFMTMAVDHALSEIDADDAQTTAVKAIADDAFAEMGPIHQRGADLRQRFHDAMARGADPAEIEALRQEGLQLADDGTRVAVERMTAVRGELTDAQWAELVALHEDGPFGHGPFGR